LDDVFAVHQAVITMVDQATEKGEGTMHVVRLAFERIMKRNRNWEVG